MNHVSAPLPVDPAVLRGDGSYPFTARIEGDDLVVRGARATWFGGAHDPHDDGETASGVSTRRHPLLLGCALPMNGYRLTAGSPLPNLPWRTTVEVTRPASGRTVRVPLIDLGPAAPPHAHAAIDLTLAAFRALGGDVRVGEMTVDFRIPGGALRLPEPILLAARSAARDAVGTDPIKRAATAQGNPSTAPQLAAAEGSRFPAPALRPVKTAAGTGRAPDLAATAPAEAPHRGTLDPDPGGTAAGGVSLAVPPSRAGENRKAEVGTRK